MYRQLLPLFFFLFSFVAAHAQQTERLIDNNPNYFYRGDQRPEGITAPADSNYMLVSYYQIAPNGVSQFGTLGTPVWIHRDSLISRGFFDGISGGGDSPFRTFYKELDFGEDYTLDVDTLDYYDQLIFHAKPLASDSTFITFPDIDDIDQYKGKLISIYSDGGELNGLTIVDAAGNSVVNQVDCRFVGRYRFADTLRSERNGPVFANYRTDFEDDYTRVCEYVTEFAELNDTTDYTKSPGRIVYFGGNDEFWYVNQSGYWSNHNNKIEQIAGDSAAAAQSRAEAYADGLAFSAGSFESKDTTIATDFTVTTANVYTVTSFCDDGADNTVSLPTPVDNLKGNVIEITHLDTSAAQSLTTRVETDGTSYHIYDNFTGDTLTFFNVYQSGQTVRFTLKEIEGVLRWVAVDLSPVVFGDKELTAVGKIRQEEDGDLYAYDSSVSGERKLQYQYTVDSASQIQNLTLKEGDQIKVSSSDYVYLIDSSGVVGQNIFDNSNQFTDIAFGSNELYSNVDFAVDGTFTADSLYNSASNGRLQRGGIPVQENTRYTLTFFVRSSSGMTFRHYITDFSVGDDYSEPLSTTLAPRTQGFDTVQINFTTPATVDTIYFDFARDPAIGTNYVVGGYQLEANPKFTEYTPTYGSIIRYNNEAPGYEPDEVFTITTANGLFARTIPQSGIIPLERVQGYKQTELIRKGIEFAKAVNAERVTYKNRLELDSIPLVIPEGIVVEADKSKPWSFALNGKNSESIIQIGEEAEQYAENLGLHNATIEIYDSCQNVIELYPTFNCDPINNIDIIGKIDTLNLFENGISIREAVKTDIVKPLIQGGQVGIRTTNPAGGLSIGTTTRVINPRISECRNAIIMDENSNNSLLVREAVIESIDTVPVIVNSGANGFFLTESYSEGIPTLGESGSSAPFFSIGPTPYSLDNNARPNVVITDCQKFLSLASNPQHPWIDINYSNQVVVNNIGTVVNYKKLFEKTSNSRGVKISNVLEQVDSTVLEIALNDPDQLKGSYPADIDKINDISTSAVKNFSFSAGPQILTNYGEKQLLLDNYNYQPGSVDPLSILTNANVLLGVSEEGFVYEDTLTLLELDTLQSQVADLESETGWAQYTDDQYTSVSPLTVAAGDTVTLFNNAASTITSDLPIGIDSLWNRTDSTIIGQYVGDAYMIRIDFTAENNSNDGYFDLGIDIGGTQDIIFQRIYAFPKGQDTPHRFSSTNAIYTLDTFIANGGKIKIIGGVGTTEIYDVNFVITRTHASPD